MEKGTEKQKSSGRANATSKETETRRPEPRPEPRPESKPESKRTSGASGGISVLKPTAPKKKTKKKPKKDDLGDLTKNLSSLIETGFSFTASRFGDHWEVTKKESESIADPLGKVLERLGINSKASEYMDFITLITATAIITVPRILITKAENEDKKGGLKLEKPSEISSAKPSKNDSGKQQQSNDNDLITSLFSEMP